MSRSFLLFSLLPSSSPFYFIYLYINTDIDLQIDIMYTLYNIKLMCKNINIIWSSCQSHVACSSGITLKLYNGVSRPMSVWLDNTSLYAINDQWVKTWFSWDFPNSSPVLSRWDLEKEDWPLWCICQVREKCWQSWYELTVAGNLQKERTKLICR